ncbi:hypothetical protein VOLCADRAFT_94769 [Volvox carteri f. nagariensis]|uniref:Uncharacterized protein n=1 Tax=Volvox carteri f. nagariensis TaxID=3068 RepID=D8U5P8_VOLCA|nr:uncharacterized protein VOLCADRAFT_94769 [Volvox carteri f. nagariensis]EFJ44959.1 hypothetical protein VOLCADRAFT_94769 [Volvox carteri f. nagariensis]|eukprot:XP_002953930.1 hypothetical protein VOLCADRAFT_94769 [Volvox carteri f. nagariensis]
MGLDAPPLKGPVAATATATAVQSNTAAKTGSAGANQGATKPPAETATATPRAAGGGSNEKKEDAGGDANLAQTLIDDLQTMIELLPQRSLQVQQLEARVASHQHEVLFMEVWHKQQAEPWSELTRRHEGVMRDLERQLKEECARTKKLRYELEVVQAQVTVAEETEKDLQDAILMRLSNLVDTLYRPRGKRRIDVKDDDDDEW